MNIVHNFGNAYIKGFLERYVSIIKDLPKGKYERYQIGRSEDHYGFRYSLRDDFTPFGSCDDRIAINEAQCKTFGFDDKEKDACLFHELGHILYPEEKDSLKKELAADSLAVDYDLGTNLISALKKMYASNVFNELENNEMMERIEHWSESFKLSPYEK